MKKQVYVTLLEPIWALTNEETKLLIAAVESKDPRKIEAAIRSLEEKLAAASKEYHAFKAKIEAEIRELLKKKNTVTAIEFLEKKFDATSQEYLVLKREIEAKIAVLNAILSNKEADWEKSYTAYQELAHALSALLSWCSYELGTEVVEGVVKHVNKLAYLCLEQIESRKLEAAQKLFAEEAKKLIDREGPSLGCDHTYPPVLLNTRSDICVVRRLTEDGYSYGFDTIYLVWRDKNGKLKYRELINSRSTKDYIHIEDVREEENKVIVEVFSGGSYSGSAWSRRIEIPLAELDLKQE